MNGDLRDRLADFLHARAAAERQIEMNGAPPAELMAVYARHERLFTPDAITEVQRWLAGSTGEDEQAGRYVLTFLVDGRSALLAAPEREQLAAWSAGTPIRIGERSVPFAAVPAVLADTADPATRHALADEWIAALFDIEPAQEHILRTDQEVVGKIGHGSYVEAREVLSGIDLRALARDGERFIADTDAVFRDLLARALPRLAGVPLAAARWADLPRLLRFAPHDAEFAASALLPRLRTLLPGQELDAFSASRVAVAEDAPTARALPLRIPGDVLLVLPAAEGYAAHQRGFQEFGAALAMAYTAPELPLEFRWLGDAAVRQAYGHLFGALLGSPTWVRRNLRLPRGERDDYLRTVTLLSLLQLRTRIGQLQYELELHHETGIGDARERYSEIMTAATGFRHSAGAFLWGIEPGFTAAPRIRAAQLAAVLAGYLRDRFDEDWFRNPSAGPALRDLFASGGRFTAAALATQLASEPLSFDRLLRRLE